MQSGRSDDRAAAFFRDTEPLFGGVLMLSEHLVGQTPRQLGEMVETRRISPYTRRGAPQLDDEVVDLGLWNVRRHDVPTRPARPRIEAEDLAPPLRNHAVDARRRLGGN